MEIFSDALKNFFWLLGNDRRLRIVQELTGRQLKPADIAKQLGEDAPTVKKYLDLLVEYKMVERGQSGYKLTNLCALLCQLIPSYSFLLKNDKFFSDHDLGNLSQRLVHNIGSLNNSGHVVGHPLILEMWSKMYESAEKYIYNVLYEVEYSKDIIMPLKKKLEEKEDFVVKTIFAKDSIIPSIRDKIAKDFSAFKLSSKLQQKMLEQVKVSTVITDKSAFLMFPRIGSTTDSNEIFYSEDPAFMQWCLDYFSECWDRAGDFDIRQVRK